MSNYPSNIQGRPLLLLSYNIIIILVRFFFLFFVFITVYRSAYSNQRIWIKFTMRWLYYHNITCWYHILLFHTNIIKVKSLYVWTELNLRNDWTDYNKSYINRFLRFLANFFHPYRLLWWLTHEFRRGSQKLNNFSFFLYRKPSYCIS